MKKLSVLGFIAVFGLLGCSINRYPVADGRYFTRIQFFQFTEFRDFEIVNGTNRIKITNGSNGTQAEVVEAATRGAVQGAVGKP